ncbi:MAG: hypothetical protein COB14_09250 [Alphaproteobacteria bacterium]|nr:MAG: hypothetical protein COB14_09250 [Alphaproteobacteria bacterium]
MGNTPEEEHLTVEGGIDEETRYLLERVFKYSKLSPNEAFSQVIHAGALEVLGKRDYVWTLEDFDEAREDRDELNRVSNFDRDDKPSP